MFTVSFRILVGAIHGSSVYINGSAGSTLPLPKGRIITVRGLHSISGVFAEVIESVPKGRYTNRQYNWEIV